MRLLTSLIGATLGLAFLASGQAIARDSNRWSGTTSTSTSSTSSGTRSGSSSSSNTVSGSTTAAPTTLPPLAENCLPETLSPAAEGRRAYMRLNCYSCHGMNGTEGGMGPSLKGEDEVEAVLEGEGGGMPSFRGKLCANDLTNLAAYLKTIGTSGAPAFHNWWEQNPSR